MWPKVCKVQQSQLVVAVTKNLCTRLLRTGYLKIALTVLVLLTRPASRVPYAWWLRATYRHLASPAYGENSLASDTSIYHSSIDRARWLPRVEIRTGTISVSFTVLQAASTTPRDPPSAAAFCTFVRHRANTVILCPPRAVVVVALILGNKPWQLAGAIMMAAADLCREEIQEAKDRLLAESCRDAVRPQL